ncbi:MAG: DUF2304 domain-containing protein [Clostridia bacterium]|nr:DUF2304 domain-containing protein [Clostridia bacterium]
MSLMMRILLIAGSLLTAFYVLQRVRKSKMRTEDSLFWLCFSLILVLMGLLPNLVTALATWMGVLSAANLVFLIVIFFLIIKLFLMDQRISALQRQVTETAQKVAIQEKEEGK